MTKLPGEKFWANKIDMGILWWSKEESSPSISPLTLNEFRQMTPAEQALLRKNFPEQIKLLEQWWLELEK